MSKHKLVRKQSPKEKCFELPGCRHKDDSDSVKMSSGRLFQIRDAAAVKALPLMLTF